MIFIFIAASFLGLSAFLGCTRQVVTERYSDFKDGFSIDFPVNWAHPKDWDGSTLYFYKLKDGSGMVSVSLVAKAGGSDPSLVNLEQIDPSAVSKGRSGASLDPREFEVSMSVDVIQLDPEKSLDDWCEYYVGELKRINEKIPQFKMRGVSSLKIDDIPAKRIEHTNWLWKTYRYVEYALISKGKLYTVRFSTPEDNLGKYQSIFSQLADSFSAQ